MKHKVFLSSVQKEFAQEREALHRHLLSDPVLHLFFVSIFRPSTVLVTEQVTEQVYINLTVTERVVWVLEGEMKRDEIQSALELKHRENFRDAYLNPAIEEGLVEMTLPDKPTSSKQSYRLTKKGLKKKKELNERKNK